jgi:hypothetical protein
MPTQGVVATVVAGDMEEVDISEDSLEDIAEAALSDTVGEQATVTHGGVPLGWFAMLDGSKYIDDHLQSGG